MSPPHTALVSDDLTGALDSAVPFALGGWRTVVATGLPALGRALAAGADVVALSLNSREVGQAEAMARAALAAAALAEVPLLFKKIDSRMKGHVHAEAAVLAAARGLGRMIICPAIPELGRFVAGGHVTGRGIPQPIPVAFAVDPSLGAGIGIDCPDAGSDADLDRIVADAGGALLVGARGLAFALARRSGAQAGADRGDARPGLPVTLVIGSRDPATLVQVDRLRAAFPFARWIAAPDGVAGAAPVAADIAILQAVDGGGGCGGAAVAARLAALAGGLSAGRSTLLFTGGETAAACLHAMGIGLLRLMGEVQPGLPISEALDFPGAPHIVTKSGGFGAADCLVDFVRVAMDQRRAP